MDHNALPSHLCLTETPTRLFKTRLRIVSFALVAILTSGAAWHHHQSLPITDAQRSTLSALVGEVSRTGVTRQKVWEMVKKNLRVRRIQDIRRGDFGRAQELLLQDLK